MYVRALSSCLGMYNLSCIRPGTFRRRSIAHAMRMAIFVFDRARQLMRCRKVQYSGTDAARQEVGSLNSSSAWYSHIARHTHPASRLEVHLMYTNKYFMVRLSTAARL